MNFAQFPSTHSLNNGYKRISFDGQGAVVPVPGSVAGALPGRSHDVAPSYVAEGTPTRGIRPSGRRA
jgi:hypothetical protein